jgi:hypothetical protein
MRGELLVRNATLYHHHQQQQQQLSEVRQVLLPECDLLQAAVGCDAATSIALVPQLQPFNLKQRREEVPREKVVLFVCCC